MVTQSGNEFICDYCGVFLNSTPEVKVIDSEHLCINCYKEFIQEIRDIEEKASC